MEKFAGGCTYLREGLRWRLLRWVVCKNRPYTIIDDEELRKVFAMLHAKVKIPCANTLAGDIKCAHGMMKEKLVELFKVRLSSPAISFDAQVCFRITLAKSTSRSTHGHRGVLVHTWAWLRSGAPTGLTKSPS